MGHGSSLPSEYKQKIHAAFQIKNTEAWRNADDFDDGSLDKRSLPGRFDEPNRLINEDLELLVAVRDRCCRWGLAARR